MKAITIWQPWASLIALGVKTIETRSWSTDYRGPLAIHAAATPAGILGLPGDCEGNQEGQWAYGYLGDYQASYCRQTGPEGRRGDTELMFVGDLPWGRRLPQPAGAQALSMPMGAVVATCRLVKVFQAQLLAQLDTAWRWDVDANRPYGDFSAGRYAWLLADIKPVEPPMPAAGQRRLWDLAWGPRDVPCPS